MHVLRTDDPAPHDVGGGLMGAQLGHWACHTRQGTAGAEEGRRQRGRKGTREGEKVPRKLRVWGGEDGRRDAALGRVDEREVSARLVIPVSHLALIRTATREGRLRPHIDLIHRATTAHALLALRDKVRQLSPIDHLHAGRSIRTIECAQLQTRGLTSRGWTSRARDPLQRQRRPVRHSMSWGACCHSPLPVRKIPWCCRAAAGLLRRWRRNHVRVLAS